MTAPFLARARGFLLDLDGVTWFGDTLAPGALDFWRFCAAESLAVAFVSNASAASRASIRDKLERLGLAGVTLEQVFPATRAAALYVAKKSPGARVLLIGEAGLAEEVTAAGCVLVERDAPFVVVGVDRAITYAKLEAACDAVLAGAELVATNGDGNYPTDRGLRPAAGPFAAFVTSVTGRAPTVVGKPEATLLRQALDWMGVAPEEAVMVGDTPEADLVAGRRAETPVVLMGPLAERAVPGVAAPELVCRDLGDLLDRLRAARPAR